MLIEFLIYWIFLFIFVILCREYLFFIWILSYLFELLFYWNFIVVLKGIGLWNIGLWKYFNKGIEMDMLMSDIVNRVIFCYLNY